LGALVGLVSLRVATAICGAGAVVAIVGWRDDRRGLRASLRASAHLVAAIWAVAWLGGFPTIRVGTGTLVLGSVGSVLAILAIVWLTNLYNFMDGIDGIAAGQAVVAGGI